MASNVSRFSRTIFGTALALFVWLAPGLSLGAQEHARTGDPGAPAPVAGPPADPADVQGWIAWKQAEGLPALPHAAMLVHRQANEARDRKDFETAVRLWRAAEELDPQALAPRFALAGHFFGRDPAQGLIEVGRIVGLARTQFRLQHYFLTSALFLAVSALALATMGIALLLCWRHRHRLIHVYSELLRKHVPGRRPGAWAWAALLLPFTFGLGVAIPAVFTLALLWNYLKKKERAVFLALAMMLLASPMAAHLFDDLSLPARENAPPFYSTTRVDQEAFRPERLDELALLSQRHPDNAFLAFAEGWTAQKGKRWDQAVAAYQRAQSLWPREARIPNNLGNIETLRGNGDAAEAHYKQAIELSPRWAAPRYNLGQLYTARYRYAEASEEIAQATALDFDMVRSLQARSSASVQPALAEEWLEPAVQWPAVFDSAPAVASGPPPAWRPWFESRGLPVAVWTLIFTALGLGLGFVLHHHLPARTCGNCAATVCRRCATRRRDQVLCVECSGLVLTATTPEFGRLLLFKRRRETRKRQGMFRLGLAALVPGYGAVAFERVFLGWTLAIVAALCGILVFGETSPFPYDPRVLAGDSRPWAGIALCGLGAVYLVSLLGTLSWQGKASENDVGLETSSGKPVARLKRAA
ncbi:MAG: tetratricopeptide repeat protein [Candidatus Eisenbacteria bacterium]